MQASAIPLAGGTAWDAMIRTLMFGRKNTSNPWSAGVVAAFQVQFAKAAGARVLTTAGLDNEDTLRQLALT